jgi:arylsulfatase A-like enzyme/predicted negative regulator of RcsB-dependent stress response
MSRFLLWGLYAAVSVVPVFSAKRDVPLNVLVITIDTLRADHLGCYGYKSIHTPNIDALGAAGVRFEHAYTPVPITLPSHTVIFTGTYPTASGMHDFSGNRLGAQSLTMASLLKENGFTTGAVVASAVLDSRFGLSRGFDFYYDHFDFNRLQEANLDEMERPGNLVADLALDWLTHNSSQRFFLWMHLYDPHYPYTPPAPFSTEYQSHPYDGEIAFADAQVGRILQFLKSKGLYEKTLIVLSGDHGEGLGEHGEKTHGFFIYDSTLHVPLIMRFPGAAHPGTVATAVSTADILPTVLELLKIPVPAQVQGVSLTAEVEGGQRNATAARGLYSETFLPRLHFNWSELRGIQFGTYHFIEAPRPELYDLERDPGELTNLFAEKKAVASEMQGKLTALVRAYTPATELAERMPLDPALIERLKALGYAGFSGGGDTSAKSSTLPDPKDRIQVYELISQGLADGQHGRYEDSVTKLTEALKTEPDSVAVHYLLGLDYYRMRDYPKSVEHLTRVMQLSPEYALAAFHLGLAHARAGHTDAAIAALNRALQLDSTNFAAAYDLGEIYLQKGMATEAAAKFRQAIAVNPESAMAHVALGELLLSQGNVDQALVELRTSVDLAPENPRAHAMLARALEAKGLPQEAEQEMRKARESAPR